LNLHPQPGLLITCVAHFDLPEEDAHPRRTIFATMPESQVNGRVVGTDGRPVDRATVMVPKYQMRAQTDDAGRFHLPALPRNETATLVVQARGHAESVDLVQSGGRAAGLVIQLEH
jgi:hypothetical protein